MLKEKTAFAGPLALWAVWLTISSILFAFAWNCWPIPNSDSTAFVPPMLTWSRGEGLLNCVWPGAREHDPTGQIRLVSHGFLFAMVIGTLTPVSDYRSIMMVMAGMESATLAVWAIIFLRSGVVLNTRLGRGWLVVLSSLSLAGLATLMIGFRGRPEMFAMLIAGVATALLLLLRRKGDWAVLGCALGVLAATHPIPCILSTFAAGGYGAWFLPFRGWIRWSIKLAGAGVLCFLVLLSWYPYSLRDWLTGCLHHSAQISGRSLQGGVLYYWITAPQATCYALVYALALVLAYPVWRSKWPLARWKVGVVLFLGALVTSAYYFGGRAPERSYNVLWAAPAFHAAILVGTTAAASRGIWQRRLAVGAALIVVGCSGVGFYRSVALFGLRRGVTWEEGRKRIVELKDEGRGPVWLDAGLFALSDNCNGLVFSETERHKSMTIVLQQADRSAQEPPLIEGYSLVEDRFDHKSPRLFGLKLGNSVRGYNYAIYRRLDVP